MRPPQLARKMMEPVREDILVSLAIATYIVTVLKLVALTLNDAFTAPGQINWFTNGTDTFIQLNTNADPTVDGIVQVSVHTVDASWLFL